MKPSEFEADRERWMNTVFWILAGCYGFVVLVYIILVIVLVKERQARLWAEAAYQDSNARGGNVISALQDQLDQANNDVANLHDIADMRQMFIDDDAKQIAELKARLEAQISDTLDMQHRWQDAVAHTPVIIYPPGTCFDPTMKPCTNIVNDTVVWTLSDQANFQHDLGWCIDNALYINMTGPGAGGVDPHGNVTACLQMMAESRARHR